MRVLQGVVLALLASGCGDSALEEPAEEELGSQISPLEDDNGLGTNGLGTNGLGTNGLGTNGLGTNGLSKPEFIDWFNQDAALADEVMRYVVACAVPRGSWLTWRNPVKNRWYRWHGSLGLTPGWAGGVPATESEQQLITACLAAHTNKYGAKVPFSLMGLKATNSPIPVLDGELRTFAEMEACFFGNLFKEEGIFAGGRSTLPSTHSSVRACGMAATGAEASCPPIQPVDRCEDICFPDRQNTYFLACIHNGKLYRALSTRIRKADVYVCGDGVCQISESCGTGHTPDNCMDCGPCP